MFGLLTVRKIKIGNNEYVATHRNPKTGKIWVEYFRGGWIDPSKYNIKL